MKFYNAYINQYLKLFNKAAERVLEAEMEMHLGYGVCKEFCVNGSIA
ncbi:hypothetical protein [Symbiopectobacterium purcellii]